MITYRITANLIIAKIKNTNGKFFGVTFIKRGNGKIRKMNARLNVKKNQTGKGMNYNPVDYGLILVFDIKIDNYRNIPEEGILSFRFQKVQFKIA